MPPPSGVSPTGPAAVTSDDILKKLLAKEYDHFSDANRDTARKEIDKIPADKRAQLLVGLSGIPDTDMPDANASPADFAVRMKSLTGILVTAGNGLSADDREHFRAGLSDLGHETSASELPDGKSATITAVNNAADQLKPGGTIAPPSPPTVPPQAPPPTRPTDVHEAMGPTDVTGFDAQQKEKMQFTADDHPLKEVHFGFDRSDLTAESKAAIKADAEAYKKALAANPNLHIYVTGHCDTTGSDPYNDALSLRRAEAVREELIHLGLDGSHILAKGEGKRTLEEQTPDQTLNQMNRSASVAFGPPPAELMPGVTPTTVATQPAAPGAAPPVAGAPGTAQVYPNGWIVPTGDIITAGGGFAVGAFGWLGGRLLFGGHHNGAATVAPAQAVTIPAPEREREFRPGGRPDYRSALGAENVSFHPGGEPSVDGPRPTNGPQGGQRWDQRADVRADMHANGFDPNGGPMGGRQPGGMNGDLPGHANGSNFRSLNQMHEQPPAQGRAPGSFGGMASRMGGGFFGTNGGGGSGHGHH